MISCISKAVCVEMAYISCFDKLTGLLGTRSAFGTLLSQGLLLDSQDRSRKSCLPGLVVETKTDIDFFPLFSLKYERGLLGNNGKSVPLMSHRMGYSVSRCKGEVGSDAGAALGSGISKILAGGVLAGKALPGREVSRNMREDRIPFVSGQTKFCS